jgi:hypothetical protein
VADATIQPVTGRVEPFAAPRPVPQAPIGQRTVSRQSAPRASTQLAPVSYARERVYRARTHIGRLPAANVEKRRCNKCGEIMRSNRYRRSLLRFVRIYRCGHCRRVFEQETRGYQGFYIGAFLTLMAPFLASALTAVPSLRPEVVVVCLVTVLGLWPVFANITRYAQAPVLARVTGQALLPADSRRSLFGRILGGESRLCGFTAGVTFSLLFFCLLAAVGLFLSQR